MIEDLKEMMQKRELIKKAKGYGYDSLCLRYKMARDAQMQLELIEDKKLTGGMKQDGIRARANRDEMRFYEILNELLGEHD